MGIKPKVGDVLWVGEHLFGRGRKYSERMVTKVGRKFFTVNIGSEKYPIETRFALGCRNGSLDGDPRGSNYRNEVWSSQEAHIAATERDTAKKELCGMFAPGSSLSAKLPDSVTTEDLRTVIRILRGEK